MRKIVKKFKNYVVLSVRISVHKNRRAVYENPYVPVISLEKGLFSARLSKIYGTAGNGRRLSHKGSAPCPPDKSAIVCINNRCRPCR